ncbi:MAG: toll/interleukin-1 receptor domain-containing protein [Chloroflexi bacterium]|nr:MAG: toll/interleukin-1 receptor domain-containing protein [Chloroflexota bacterium]
MKLFLSYSRKDKKFTEAIYRFLVKQGFDVWFDKENIYGGEEWTEEIQQAIDACDAVVVIWSHNANQSDWVKREISYADSKNKLIIPIKIDDIDPGAYIILNSRQFIIAERQRFTRQVKNDLLKALNSKSSSTHARPTQANHHHQIKLSEPWAIIIAAIITGVFVIIAAIIPLMNTDDDNLAPTPSLSISSPTEILLSSLTSSPPPTHSLTLPSDAVSQTDIETYLAQNGLVPDEALENFTYFYLNNYLIYRDCEGISLYITCDGTSIETLARRRGIVNFSPFILIQEGEITLDMLISELDAVIHDKQVYGMTKIELPRTTGFQSILVLVLQ